MMPARAPIVWMNVTTSVSWNRPPVGIVRVERALAEKLQELLGPERFKLCVWRDERFVEWVDSSALTVSEQVEKAVDVILPRSASFDLARPYVLRALREYATSPQVSPNDRLRLDVPTDVNLRIHPHSGDFVISVGLDWDAPYTARFYSLSKKLGLRIITCCYDLIPVLFPQYCVGEVAKRFTEYFLQLSWGSEAVLCISEQTRNDYTRLCRELGAPDRKTVVIPLGDSIPSRGGEVGEQVQSLSQNPFILFVSTIERRKNHEVLYRAYHLLARRGHASVLPKLVFVGMPGWGVGDFLKDIELDPFTRGLTVQLNHVTDAELNHLYKHASFCVYPSLYEGWGLPVGEALALGKAVVASAEGSLPEVGGSLVRYVSPWNVYAWADALLELIQNPDMIRVMEKTVQEKYTPRQWSQTAKVVKTLIEEMSCAADAPVINLLPGYEMSTHAGIHVGPSIRTNGTEGLLLFGPHRALRSGCHQVQVYGTVSDRGEHPITFDVSSHGGTKTYHVEQVTLVHCSEEVFCITRFNFTLPRDVDDFEVRCFVCASTLIEIDRIEIIYDGIELRGAEYFTSGSSSVE